MTGDSEQIRRDEERIARVDRAKIRRDAHRYAHDAEVTILALLDELDQVERERNESAYSGENRNSGIGLDTAKRYARLIADRAGGERTAVAVLAREVERLASALSRCCDGRREKRYDRVLIGYDCPGWPNCRCSGKSQWSTRDDPHGTFGAPGGMGG